VVSTPEKSKRTASMAGIPTASPAGRADPQTMLLGAVKGEVLAG